MCKTCGCGKPNKKHVKTTKNSKRSKQKVVDKRGM